MSGAVDVKGVFFQSVIQMPSSQNNTGSFCNEYNAKQLVQNIMLLI